MCPYVRPDVLGQVTLILEYMRPYVCPYMCPYVCPDVLDQVTLSLETALREKKVAEEAAEHAKRAAIVKKRMLSQDAAKEAVVHTHIARGLGNTFTHTRPGP